MYENKAHDSPEVQQIVKEWQQYISQNFYICDKRMLLYLGNLYITDERFSEFINRFGNDDLASFFNKAIGAYCLIQRDTRDEH